MEHHQRTQRRRSSQHPPEINPNGLELEQKTRASHTGGRVKIFGTIFEITTGIPHKSSQYQSFRGTNRYSWQSSRPSFPKLCFSPPWHAFPYFLSLVLFILLNSCIISQLFPLQGELTVVVMSTGFGDRCVLSPQLNHLPTV